MFIRRPSCILRPDRCCENKEWEKCLFAERSPRAALTPRCSPRIIAHRTARLSAEAAPMRSRFRIARKDSASGPVRALPSASAGHGAVRSQESRRRPSVGGRRVRGRAEPVAADFVCGRRGARGARLGSPPARSRRRAAGSGCPRSPRSASLRPRSGLGGWHPQPLRSQSAVEAKRQRGGRSGEVYGRGGEGGRTQKSCK